MIMQVLNTLFLAAFAMSALVQYNDPDAAAWVLIYAAAAALCLAQYRKTPPRWLAATLLIASLAWIGALLPDVVGRVPWRDIFDSISMRSRAVEEAREMGGLALVALWSAVLFLKRRPA